MIPAATMSGFDSTTARTTLNSATRILKEVIPEEDEKEKEEKKKKKKKKKKTRKTKRNSGKSLDNEAQRSSSALRSRTSWPILTTFSRRKRIS